MDEIKINCKAADTLDIQDMTLFQGELKSRTDADYEHIKKSILEYGFCAPFFIWEHDGANSVLDGTGRYETLQRMKSDGYDVPLLPVAYIDCKDEATAKKVLLQINSHNGTMSVDSVRDFLGDVEFNFAEITLPDSGALDFSDDDTEGDTQGDDDSPDVNEEEKPDSELGEMYDLGGNILMCGDSTDAEQVTRLMGGQYADLVLTDPPYNVSYEGKTKDKLKIKNDIQEDTSFRLFLTNSFKAFAAMMKDGASFYIWHADLEGYNFRGACRDSGLEVKECLIWNKNSLVLGRQDYQWKHEPCLYGWKAGASHSWYSDRKQTTVINFDRPTVSKEHPTMKPVGLFEYLIRNSSKEGDIILDPFLGSGTSIIACAKSNRRCFGMELDPHYCDVIRRRWTKWAIENGKEAGTGALD